MGTLACLGRRASRGYHDPKGLHFHLSDALGTRRVQTNVLGAVEETFQSLPFGDGYLATSMGLSTSDDSTENHFTGKERDGTPMTESGNDYFGARYYNSSVGRWLAPDPKQPSIKHLGNPQKWNKYVYVLNNPLAMFDPDGQEEMTVVYRTFIAQQRSFSQVYGAE